MRGTLLAIDAGQSATRALLLDGDDRVMAHAQTGGVSHLAAGGSIQRMLRRVSAVWTAAAPESAELDVLAIGLSGWGNDSARAQRLVAAIAEVVPAGRIRAASDAFTAFLGAADGQPGVVLAVGTGSVAVAADGSGRWRKADGRGAILGDVGSAFWIGREGLRAAFDAASADRGPAELLRRAVERYGPIETIEDRVNSDRAPIPLVAAFAIDVAEAASAGDRVARRIWAGAVRALAQTVCAAAAGVFPGKSSVRITVTGGLTGAGDMLARPLTRAIRAERPGSSVLMRSDAPIAGSIELGRDDRVGRWFPDGIVEWARP